MRRGEIDRTIWLLIPARASFKMAETEQLYQVKRIDCRNRGHVALDPFSN